MEKHLSVLTQALNKANQAGAFTLQESAMVANSLGVITQVFQSQAKESSIEKAREEARQKNQDKSTELEEGLVEVAEKPQEKSN